MRVKLEGHEIYLGSMVGVLRQVENLQLNRRPAYGAGRDQDWQLNIEGALGEMAVAKVENIFWGKGSLGDDDVGSLQVRTTSFDNGRLIIHHRDSDDKPYYLVTGLNGDYNIRGWLYGHEAKQDKWWSDPTGRNRPAFFVPQHELRPCKSAK